MIPMNEDLELSQNAKFMLLWIGDPKQLSEYLDSQVPLIRATENQILKQDTKEVYSFPTASSQKTAMEGLKELKEKGLIKTDRYGDVWLTDKGTFLLGTRQGLFPKLDVGTYFI